MEDNNIQNEIFKELQLSEEESRHISIDAKYEKLGALLHTTRPSLNMVKIEEASVSLSLPLQTFLIIGGQKYDAFGLDFKLEMSINGNAVNTTSDDLSCEVLSDDDIHSHIQNFWDRKLNKYGFYDCGSAINVFLYCKKTFSAEETLEAVRWAVNFKKEFGF